MKKEQRAEIIKKTLRILKDNPDTRPADIARAFGLWDSTASNIYRDAVKVLNGEMTMEEAFWPKPKQCGRPRRYIRLRIPLEIYNEYANRPLQEIVERGLAA